MRRIITVIAIAMSILGCNNMERFSDKYGYKINRNNYFDKDGYYREKDKIIITDSTKFYSKNTLAFYIKHDSLMKPYVVKIK